MTLGDKIAAVRRRIDSDRIADAVLIGVMFNDNVSEAVRFPDKSLTTFRQAASANALAVLIIAIEANAHP